MGGESRVKMFLQWILTELYKFRKLNVYTNISRFCGFVKFHQILKILMNYSGLKRIRAPSSDFGESWHLKFNEYFVSIS